MRHTFTNVAQRCTAVYGLRARDADPSHDVQLLDHRNQDPYSDYRKLLHHQRDEQDVCYSYEGHHGKSESPHRGVRCARVASHSA